MGVELTIVGGRVVDHGAGVEVPVAKDGGGDAVGVEAQLVVGEKLGESGGPVGHEPVEVFLTVETANMKVAGVPINVGAGGGGESGDGGENLFAVGGESKTEDGATGFLRGVGEAFVDHGLENGGGEMEGDVGSCQHFRGIDDGFFAIHM